MSFRAGRTIGEQRERLETRNERNAARKKDKNRQRRRVIFASVGFLALFVTLILLALSFSGDHDPIVVESEPASTSIPDPTVEIIDEDSASGSHITGRMRDYIGQAEQDFRDLGYQPTKVVVPTGTIREVDFYLTDHPGFIKLHIDRPTAVSVEDADRLIRYLADQGINEYQYLDVRIAGRAYWK